MDRPFPAYEGNDPFVFISYSHADAEEVYSDLTGFNQSPLNIWYDDGIAPGYSWREEVAEAIENASLVVFFISPESIASRICLQEVNFALSRQKRVLCVYLRKTRLTIGLELTLNEMQAINKTGMSESEYLRKLIQSSSQLLETENKHTLILDRQVRVVDEACIAILPFQNISRRPEDKYLCEGLCLELTNRISVLSGLSVIFAASYGDGTVETSTIGRKLGAGYCLGGGLQVAGNKVRTNIRLEETSKGKTLFADRFDHALDDVFSLQDDIADSVIRHLCAELRIEPADISEHELSENSEAYNAYLHAGFAQRKDTQDGFREAIQQYLHAIRLDPGFGRAHFQLALCYWQFNVFSDSADELKAKATRSFELAQAAGYVPDIPWIELYRRIDPSSRPSPDILLKEGIEKIVTGDRSWGGFEYAQIGACLGAAGYFNASLDYWCLCLNTSKVEKTQRDEIDFQIRSLLSVLGHFEKAIEMWTSVLVEEPGNNLARGERAILFSRIGRFQEAESDLEVVRAAIPVNFYEFYHLFWKGDQHEARSYFRQVENLESLQMRFKFWGCFLLSEFDKGIEYLQTSMQRGAPPFAVWVLLNRVLPNNLIEELSSKQAFIALFKRYGVDDEWRERLRLSVNEISDRTGISI
jgi:TolB-like protein